MRNRTLGLASALTAALVLAGVAAAQPPDRSGGRPRGVGGPGGPGGAVERALDDLKLSGTTKERADAAVRAYRENVRTLLDLARSDLLVKMMDVLSEEDFKKFKEALPSPPAPGPGGRGPRFGRGLSADAIVERLLSFDKNQDGKITKDELPERMQGLIEKGDTNKDGALDKDEIKKLADDLARDGPFRGRFGRGGPGRGFFPAGRGGARGFGGAFPPGGGAERALEGLKLADKKKEAAAAVVKAHQESVPKLLALARADLLVKMKDVLSEEDFKKFKEAVERRPGFGPPR